jgi:two-component system chemotaxis response regulator CheY
LKILREDEKEELIPLGRKVLLINDSKFESLVLRDMLIGLKYDVEIADEFDALYEINQFSPDLVIVNFIMQEIRGDKLIAMINAENPEIKCLLSSSNPVMKIDLTSIKIDGILRTPPSLVSIKDILERIGERDGEGEMKEAHYCKWCKKDISLFLGIVFCPYCGNQL